MLMNLKPGMTKAQVRFVLGTPLIQDTFHKKDGIMYMNES